MCRENDTLVVWSRHHSRLRRSSSSAQQLRLFSRKCAETLLVCEPEQLPRRSSAVSMTTSAKRGSPKAVKNNQRARLQNKGTPT